MLPIMLSVQVDFPDYQFVIAGAPSLDADYYSAFTKDSAIPVVSGNTYELISHASAALVTSGTATLETALLGTPEVVCYKGSYISYQIAKRIITLKYISLVNLIMDKEVVKELIQDELNTKNLKLELNKILNTESRAVLLQNYADLKLKLGGEGSSKKTAELIVNSFKK